MKKVLWLIVCLMTMVLTSCGTNYLVTANYDVCYPDGVKTQSESVVVNSYNEDVIRVVSHSYGGTNYISITKSDNPLMGSGVKLQHITSTTAPIRLNSFNVEKCKKKAKHSLAKNDIYMSDIIIKN